jgi:hypothetical protein
MHEVNEVIGVAPVNPNACPDRFLVDLYLRGISAPYRLDHVSIDEYKWLKESVGAHL